MFNLERVERCLIIFLLGTALIGAGLALHEASRPAGSLRIAYAKDHRSATKRSTGKTEGKIDINRASAGELIALKGVGAAIAKRIADHRAAHGLFVTKEDIRKVPGIGDKLYARIKDDITLE